MQLNEFFNAVDDSRYNAEKDKTVYDKEEDTRKSRLTLGMINELRHHIQARRSEKQTAMELYKKKGVNPLGTCFPMLLQMPLLFALFTVFRSTIELRGEPFVFWIKDLSAPDPISLFNGFGLINSQPPQIRMIGVFHILFRLNFLLKRFS